MTVAGEWIPMRLDLADDPAVIGLAARLGLDEFGVVGRLHRLWVWANQQLADGNAASVTEKWIDRYTMTPGFAAALVEVGWLTVDGGGFSIPKFDRWNSKGAKKRLLTSRRVKDHRNAPSVTKALPEERREEKRVIPPNPPKTGGESVGRKPRKPKTDAETDPRFVRFWSAYPNKVAKPKAAEAFAKIDPGPELVERILAAVEQQKAGEKWTKDGGQFIPHPTTWLNQKRWEDLPPEVSADAARTPPRKTGFKTITDTATETLTNLFGDRPHEEHQGPRIVTVEPPATLGGSGRTMDSQPVLAAPR